MKATISVDHCISDGAETAQFIQMLSKERRDDAAGFLEYPVRMFV